MLTNHQKWRMLDENGKNAFIAEVNWDESDERTNKCKIVKFTLTDGKEVFVKKENLYTMLFAMGSPEEQQKMVPQKVTKVRAYETVLGIKATKDIHKGEVIRFPIKIDLPPIEEEVIGELKQEYKESGLVYKR